MRCAARRVIAAVLETAPVPAARAIQGPGVEGDARLVRRGMRVHWSRRRFPMNRSLLVLLTAVPMMASQRDWKTATLVEVTRLTPTKESGVTTNQSYTFDLGDRLLVCADPSMSWVRIRVVNVKVGSQIRYVRAENSTLLFLDSKGKEHKCVIQHETVKPTTPQ